MGNWSDLHTDLLLLIAKHSTIRDQAVVRAVCKQWGSVLKKNPCSGSDQIPWLLVPRQDNPKSYGFYDMSEEKKIYPVDIPEAAGARCCGSSHGWLVMTGMTPSVYMFNPLTGSRIELPPLSTLPNVVEYCPCRTGEEYMALQWPDTVYHSSEFMKLYGVRQAVLSGNPSLVKNYTVMIRYSEYQSLAFCRKGDDKWTLVDNKYFYADIFYCKGFFLAVDDHCFSLLRCNFNGPVPVLQEILHSEYIVTSGDHNYLVLSRGQLYLACRMYDIYSEELHKDMIHCGGYCVDLYVHGGPNPTTVPNEEEANADELEGEDDDENTDDDGDDGNAAAADDEPPKYGTTYFKIYKPDFQKKIWRRVREIPNKALFLGVNESICRDARIFPGCEGNHVYFSNDQTSPDPENTWPQDLGAMDLKTRKIYPFPGCAAGLATPSQILPEDDNNEEDGDGDELEDEYSSDDEEENTDENGDDEEEWIKYGTTGFRVYRADFNKKIWRRIGD